MKRDQNEAKMPKLLPFFRHQARKKEEKKEAKIELFGLQEANLPTLLGTLST